MKRSIPIIKENNLDKIIKCLQCIGKFSYNREKFTECILKVYPNKTEKSVLRGMAIPSLRHLGLIVGFAEFIRASANGKLILKSKCKGDEKFRRAIRAIFMEIDHLYFQFIPELKKYGGKSIRSEKFLQTMIKDVNGPSDKQKKERIKRWLKLLKQCDLIKINERISIDSKKINLAKKDLDPKTKRTFFKQYLFQCYSTLASESAGIVDISNLRTEVALQVYAKKKEILTELQFDDLLREIPKVTDEYIISLGQPMGAMEKLFKCGDSYYRTINIKIFQEKE